MNERGSEVFILLGICPSDPSNIVIIITSNYQCNIKLLCGVVVNMLAFENFGLGSSPGDGNFSIWTSISKSHLVANIIP